MKDDKKDSQVESTTETSKDSKDLDRGAFLKALGVGIGAAGISVITGGRVSASTEPDSTRGGIQKLMRTLLENPSRAEDFLSDPQAVAEEFGVRLTADDSNKIKEAFTRLARKAGGVGETSHSDCHTDSGHTDCTSGSAASGKRGVIKPKLPEEGVAPKRRR